MPHHHFQFNVPLLFSPNVHFKTYNPDSIQKKKRMTCLLMNKLQEKIVKIVNSFFHCQSDKLREKTVRK